MKKILVVEDAKAVRENVAEILTLSGYSVTTARNGKEGLDKINKYIPDLIVCDMMMPVIDGLSMLHVLRTNPATEGIPFIFLTAKIDRNDFRMAMDLGADDYITKPFNGDELLRAVENRFRRVAIMKKDLSPGIKGLDELMKINETYKDSLETLHQGPHQINIYKKKELIFKEGQWPHYLFYVQKGKVRTFRTHEDGKQLVMNLYKEGDFFGYLALLEEGTYKASAETLEEAILVLIPKKDFEELLSRSPEVQKKLIKMLAKNVIEKETQLLGIAYNTLRKKVANALLVIEKKYNTGKDQPFEIDMARSELSTIAATATESLIRTLTEFRDEHLIDIRNNKIHLLNIPRLQKLLY